MSKKKKRKSNISDFSQKSTCQTQMPWWDMFLCCLIGAPDMITWQRVIKPPFKHLWLESYMECMFCEQIDAPSKGKSHFWRPYFISNWILLVFPKLSERQVLHFQCDVSVLGCERSFVSFSLRKWKCIHMSNLSCHGESWLWTQKLFLSCF